MLETLTKSPTFDLVDANEIMLDLIRKRRTIRRFTDEDVSGEQVQTMLEMAMNAPSRLDRRPWQFVVIRDQTLRSQLAEILRVHPYLEQAPVVIAVGAMPQLSPTWMMDISAATENLVLAATALGLGAAWLANPDTALWNRVEEALHKALAIPRDDIRIPALVAVGHPDQELEPHSRHDRFEGNKVHYDRWGARQPH